jgi:predicted phosphate transport protein (TIGR00153 family)
MGILQLLIPKDRIFFPLLEKASLNLVTISKALYDALTTTSAEERVVLIREIERIEHEGDKVTHEIMHQLSATFITPFDREDIHELTSAIDDILDHIHGSAKRIEIYKVTNISPAMIKLAELIQQAADELYKAIHELRDLKNTNTIREASIKINSIENHADDVFDNAVAKLFEEEKNAIELIKIKEVLQNLETATDKCEDAANVLSSILVKHS